jgi:Zn-dependent protease
LSTELEQALVFFGCLVVAVILHEVSHGVVASWFGDDTARRAGRVTLNPIPHIDPFGSLILPAMGALAGLPVLGWAKPVPVNAAKLGDPRRDMVFVSLAGPATNFVLTLVSALAARVLFDPASVPPVFGFSDLPLGIQVLFSFAMVNLFLGVFNLLPIPPLDGSALIERVLPAGWLPAWHRFRPFGILVLFILVFATGFVGRVLEPFFDELVDFVFTT